MNHKRSIAPYNPYIADELRALGKRIEEVIQPMSQRAFAEIWGIAPVSVGRYIHGKHSPRIEDLNTLAQLTDVDLLWLVAGEHYSQSRWLQSNQNIKICLDDCMFPTLTAEQAVVISQRQENDTIEDGVYCLATRQGYTFRRLLWDEEKQGFWLICDNTNFEPHFNRKPNIIGKVSSALMSIS
ncbi:helix-turn-helix domain-containing protein [Vibrio sp. OPT18]|uniref:helix-turn-helix domain-containing protein n=1 Tax=Vibrio sp. OPT18 TaxID=2778641 RepID=UPI001882DE7A|nr:helix-turn-helix domain-containing protein [Vibrio sp. OPT18]MBE8574107.1 helix-turn-helix domain-containing protein [Vibrio sp. OPT18]